MKNKIIALQIILIVLVGCSSNTADAPTPIEATTPVHVMHLSNDSFPITVDYLGTINADTIKKYSFKVSGKISELFVSEGDYISDNSTLASLETQDYSLSAENALSTFNQAKSAFNHAEKYYIANQELFKEQAISEYQFDTVKTEYEVAKATFESARTAYVNSTNQLSETTLKSDFDGYVLDVLYKVGENIQAGHPIILASNDIPTVSIGIIPDDIKTIKEGMIAKVMVNDDQIDGEISSISKLPDSNTRTYTATIEIKDDYFVIGQFAEVSIIIGQESGISIPITSVRSDGQSYVYIVENNIAVKKYIDTKIVLNDYVIVSGLDEGDQLIISGINNIKNMSKISIMNDGE